MVENAWPALVDAELFDKMQQRLREMQQARTFTTGRSIKTRFLLSGTLCCGVCGGKLIGQTSRRRNNSGTMRHYRHYVCGTHHKGQHGRCPERYGIPAEVIEGQVIDLIKSDLMQLKGDQQLHQYVAEELAKACGSRTDSRDRLKAQLAELDAQASKLATHLAVLDVQTATTLGLYAKAKALADERQRVESKLQALQSELPELPEPSEIARRADEELSHLDKLIASGSLEEQRELIRHYVKGAKTHPAKKEIELSFLPALFSRIATGALPYP